jgi:hypothetical protein
MGENGYRFSVRDTWVYRAPPEIKARLHAPIAVPQRTRLATFPRGQTPPADFDIRDIAGRSYIGDIRDQGTCGSCYAFSANACAEAVFNARHGKYYRSGDTDHRSDFSESSIMWCLGRLPAYNPIFFGCDGAKGGYLELEALCNQGGIFETDFPYTETDPGSCSHWADQTVRFKDWSAIAANDMGGIKEAIYVNGAVDATIYAGAAFDAYDGGIYEDANTDCNAQTSNHMVALIATQKSAEGLVVRGVGEAKEAFRGRKAEKRIGWTRNGGRRPQTVGVASRIYDTKRQKIQCQLAWPAESRGEAPMAVGQGPRCS